MKNKKQKEEDKRRILSQTEELTEKQIKEQEQQALFSDTDALTPEQLKERNKEREREKFEIIKGDPTSIKERKDFAATIRQPYRIFFGREVGFFEGVSRLKGWPLEECKKFVKRREFANIINRLLYNRFHPEVVAHIKNNNPLVFCYVRKFKHSQFITKEAQGVFEKMISDFVLMMIGYSEWDRFEYDYCTKNNLPVQLKLGL